MYRLEGEPETKFSLMCQMDGNNSLKRTNAFVKNVTERIDSRKARADYWLSPEEVDEWKDDVKPRAVCPPPCLSVT